MTTYFSALHMQAVFHATDYSGKKLSVIVMITATVYVVVVDVECIDYG